MLLDLSRRRNSRAQTIKKTAELDWKPLQILTNVSASVGAVMKPAGFENAQGVLSAAYAKDAADPQWKNDPGMKKWSDFLDKYMPGADKHRQRTWSMATARRRPWRRCWRCAATTSPAPTS